MFLVTAGAFVDPSIEAEFGRLPPTFLPLGNRRLLRHQFELARSFARPICVSLPDDFEVPPNDRRWMTQHQVIDLRIPPGLRLGDSILHALKAMGEPSSPVRILHGDTLFESLPNEVDLVSTNVARTSHGWSTFESLDHGTTPRSTDSGHAPRHSEVLSGYFAFGDPRLLLESLEASGGDLITAIRRYHQRSPLRPVAGRGWLDLGDLVNYYRARGRYTTERAFNDLDVNGRIVRKSSKDTVKIRAEIEWFRRVPASIRISCPTMLDDFEQEGEVGYRLEYLHLPSLSELAVFGELDAVAWTSMLEACRAFVESCRQQPQPGAVGAEDHRLKTLLRLQRWAQTSSASLEAPTRLNGRRLPTLLQIVDRLASRLPSRVDCTLVHGDLCFSNVFYDSRAEIIRVIDPRGLSFDGRPALGGDPSYDVAKIHHSAVGLYDFILAGEVEVAADAPTDLRFHLHERPRHAMLRRAFDEVFAAERGAPVTALSALLFLGMLPLHADCPRRQAALLANGMRLFLEAEGEES